MRYYRTLAFYRSSKGDKHYTVKIDQDSGLSCNCPQWIYRPVNGQRGCRHTVLAREEFARTIEAVREHGLSIVESPFVPIDY